MDALSHSHESERLSFSCNSPKRIIACYVPTPILLSRAFSSKDILIDWFVGDDSSALSFHAMEIPLLLEKLGLAGDTSPEVMIIAVGGRICWRMFGGFLIGQGQTPLGSGLTPYSEIAQPATRVMAPAAFLQHAIYPK